MNATEMQRRFVAALQLPTIETRISYVLLSGEFAYKNAMATCTSATSRDASEATLDVLDRQPATKIR